MPKNMATPARRSSGSSVGSQIWANNCHKLISRRSTSPDYSAPNHNEQPPNDRPPAPHIITRIKDPDLIGAFEAERPKFVPYVAGAAATGNRGYPGSMPRDAFVQRSHLK